MCWYSDQTPQACRSLMGHVSLQWIFDQACQSLVGMSVSDVEVRHIDLWRVSNGSPIGLQSLIIIIFLWTLNIHQYRKVMGVLIFCTFLYLQIWRSWELVVQWIHFSDFIWKRIIYFYREAYNTKRIGEVAITMIDFPFLY